MLKELRSQHRSIIQMSFNGFKNNEIAEKLGMSPATISQILRSPLGQAYLNGLIDKAQEDTLDVRKKLISLNKGALGTIERILDPKQKAPFNVQLTAAKDVLDRNGYKPSDKFEIDVFSHKTDDEIENEIRAMEAAVARSQIAKAHQNGHDEESSEGYSLPLDDHTQDAIATTASSTPATASQSDTAQNSNTSFDSDLPLMSFPKEDFTASGETQTRPSEYNLTHSTDTKAALPPDIQAKLEDTNFDPFKNID